MKHIKIFTVVFALVLLVPLAGNAMTIKNGQNILVSENIDGNFFAAGNLVTIDGTIDGDVFVAGNNIDIRGTVNGDVFVAGSNINISGDIKGNLRAVGSSINISGKVERNILAASANLIINKEASVGRHITYAGANLIINGPAGGQIDAGVQNATLNSSVSGDVELRMGPKSQLAVLSQAVINGNLYYTAEKEAIIQQGAQIRGEKVFTQWKAPVTKRQLATFSKFTSLGFTTIFFLNMFLLGLIFIYLVPKKIARITSSMKEKFWANLGMGVMTLIVAPIVAILLLITLVGIPFSLVLVAGYLTALYFSGVIAAVAVGDLIVQALKWKIHKVLSLLLGLVVVCAAGIIPFIGSLAVFLAMLWAFGAVLRTEKEILKEWR